LSKDIQNRLKSLSTGSTVDHLNLGDLRSFELPNLPDLQEQRKIGQVLSNFDKKIDSNRAILQLLEEISQSVFENRFVDYEPYQNFKQTELGNIPADFEIVEVDDLIWSGRGYSYTSDHLDKENEKNDSYPMINLKNVKEGGGFQTDGYKYYTEESIKDRYHIEKGDLVVAITEQTLDGSLIGSPSLIPQIDAEKSIISQDLAKIVPDEIPNVFFYHLFNSNRFDDYTTSVATGTTVYHLSLTSIGEFKFALPPMEDINKFVSVVEDFHEMKYNMIDEISRLENLRDTLLPKLVSGEVRVNDINLDDLEVGSEV
jgi:type I restriction enzyme S subunit